MANVLDAHAATSDVSFLSFSTHVLSVIIKTYDDIILSKGSPRNTLFQGRSAHENLGLLQLNMTFLEHLTLEELECWLDQMVKLV